MKTLRKVLIVFMLTIFAGIIRHQSSVKASSLESWNYPSEWEVIEYMPSPNLVDVLVDSSNVSKPAKFSKISSTSDPFFEYQYTVLYGYDEYHNWHYIAVIMDLWMSPNNTSNDNCRSDLMVVTSTYADGAFVQGAPLSQSDVTVITSSIGGSLQIGVQGKTPNAAITGSFTTSKTNNKYDLAVGGYHQKINSTDTYARRFMVKFDYYDPYRNDCYYIESTSMLQYGVIYKVPSKNESVNIDWIFNANFVYDFWLWNANIYRTVNYDMTVNANTHTVTFN